MLSFPYSARCGGSAMPELRCWWAWTRGPTCCRRVCWRKGPAAGRRSWRPLRPSAAGVIDVVAPLVPAVKPSGRLLRAAWAGRHGRPGEVIAYAQQQGLLVILTASGTTSARRPRPMPRAFGRDGQSPWGADALT